MTSTSPSSLLSRAAISPEPLAPWCGVAASVTPEYDAIGETKPG